MLCGVDKGLHQHRAIIPTSLPIILSPPSELPKNMARQMRNPDPREQNEATVVEPTEVLGVVIENESDNRYVECALAGKAQYIISDDNHLLKIGDYRGIVILSPAAFVALLSLGEKS